MTTPPVGHVLIGLSRDRGSVVAADCLCGFIALAIVREPGRLGANPNATREA
jgi:hypothetical protein